MNRLPAPELARQLNVLNRTQQNKLFQWLDYRQLFGRRKLRTFARNLVQGVPSRLSPPKAVLVSGTQLTLELRLNRAGRI